MLKDEVLNTLAEKGGNIAQFVSWGPDGNQRFGKIRGQETPFPNMRDAITTLLERSEPRSANIRTFLPEKPDGNPFKYGLMDQNDIESMIRSFNADGYHVILNQTIPVNDGGWSGVLFGATIEGAPNDIPRCVEKPGCMRLPRDVGFGLINAVYGFHFHVPFGVNDRVEFSVHPFRRGYLNDFQIIWQVDRYETSALPQTPDIKWPNRYSEAVGDKAFGLLMAHILGFPVPKTTVFGRLIPQFQFGTGVGNNEPPWVRTAPKEQTPGKFTTSRGWADPFEIMRKEDPEGKLIAAILVQDGIKAQFSGSAITGSDGLLVVEGCKGYGDRFMVGEVGSGKVPDVVHGELNFVYERLREKLGDVRFEWVFDGEKVWIVQLHCGRSDSSGDVIYPGTPQAWLEFKVERGLESLRTLIADRPTTSGIVLVGNVGITSHFGDVLRKSKVPSFLKRT